MADFDTAIRLTLVHEGGFQKEPNDHANWSSGVIGEGELIGTKYGVTALDMPGVDIENITEDQAVQFYSERYWKQLYSQISSQAVANKVFDMGVLLGVGEAVKLLQIVLQTSDPNLTVDSDFGNETLTELNQIDEASLLNAYKTALVAYVLRIAVNKPAERGNIGGWIKRINS